MTNETGMEAGEQIYTEEEFNDYLHSEKSNLEVVLTLFGEGKLDEQYGEYLMEHCSDRVVICNGDTLIGAMESGRFDHEFVGYLVERMEANDKDFIGWVEAVDNQSTKGVSQ